MTERKGEKLRKPGRPGRSFGGNVHIFFGIIFGGVLGNKKLGLQGGYHENQMRVGTQRQ